MIQGLTKVYSCPSCGKLLTSRCLLIGNMLGSVLYSDGKRVSPMNPSFPDLTKCKGCDTIFFLSDLEEIGKYRFGEKLTPAWQDADESEFLSIADYHRAIESRVADEIFLRERLWWAYNDRIRNEEVIFQDIHDEARWENNLRELLTLLDITKVNQKIMAAEIHRNLGEFDECIRMIASIKDNSLDWLKDKFIEECRIKYRWLMEVN